MRADYYIHGYLIDTTNPEGGLWVKAWQQVTLKPVMIDVKGVLTPNGQEYAEEVGFVSEKLMPDGTYDPIITPATYEFHPTTKDKHFAPGQLQDPAAVKPSGRSLPEIVAELKAALAANPITDGTAVIPPITPAEG